MIVLQKAAFASVLVLGLMADGGTLALAQQAPAAGTTTTCPPNCEVPGGKVQKAPSTSTDQTPMIRRKQGQGQMMQGEEMRRPRHHRMEQTQTGQQSQSYDQNTTTQRRRHMTTSDQTQMETRHFRYDPNRMHRRHHHDREFRFFYEGFWYDQPYWQGGYYAPGYSYGIHGRLSCGEGRRLLVRHFGFRAVRPVVCTGPVYRYRAIRHGAPVLVTLSARTGRIIAVRHD